MKKIFIYSLLLGATALGFNSCMEVDNYDEPDAHVYGTIIDSTTGQPYQSDQGETHIRIWEKSYSLNPTPQDLAVKEDGTYNNERLFKGTYDMVPYDGSWWPCDTITGVKIGGGTQQNFTVTPYLKVKDFTAEYTQDEDGNYWIEMSGRLFAPITENLPQVREVRPFLSLNKHCGGANHIDYYYKDDYRINLRQNWNKLGDMETGEGNETYSFRLPVKAGYHYWVRMGVNVNDQYLKWNYSEVKEIIIPQ